MAGVAALSAALQWWDVARAGACEYAHVGKDDREPAPRSFLPTVVRITAGMMTPVILNAVKDIEAG